MLWGEFERYGEAVQQINKQQMKHMAIAMRMAGADAKDFSKWIDE